MIYEAEKFYILFDGRHKDGRSGVTEVTPDTFTDLEPYAIDLSYGDTPDDLADLIWGDDGLSDQADWDMRPSELAEFDNKPNVLWVANG